MFLKRFLYNLLPTPLKNGINDLHLKDFIQQLGKEKRETALRFLVPLVAGAGLEPTTSGL